MLKFADIISNPVDKQSACVKWKQRFEHSSSSNRSVPVNSQHSTVSLSHPAVPTP